jgi:hypothetical protein
MPAVSRVGIVAKHHLRQAAPHLADIAHWLRERGLEPVFEAATAALYSPSCEWPVREKDALVREVDMVLVSAATARCSGWPIGSARQA